MLTIKGMDGVRGFVRGIVESIPDRAGLDGTDGKLILPKSLPNPSRKRARQDTPEPTPAGVGASGD